jgi:hypothetical protein
LFVLTGQHRKATPREENSAATVFEPLPFLREEAVTRLPANFLSPLTMFSRELMLVCVFLKKKGKRK